MSAELIKITADDLIPLDEFTETHPIVIDLVYAKPDHPDNMFKTAIYRPEARLWAHRDIVMTVLLASEICYAQSGYIFELKDCLRPVEAQALMAETPIVKANPHWLVEPNRLLSPPGQGGHPRGQAIDIILLDQTGAIVDMGTPFDYLTTDPAVNPAARSFRDLPQDVLNNRMILESAMLQAAREIGTEIYPIPQEWWDFRFPREVSAQYKPISDFDLPEDMRMTDTRGKERVFEF